MEGLLSVTTEEETRKGDLERINKSEEESERVKSTIYRKNEDKTNYLLKSKINYEEKEAEPSSIKSKNNFLNLSILKHI